MGMATLSISEEMVLGLGEVADHMGMTVDALAGEAIRRFLREEAERKIHREERHFRAQHARLLGQYHDQFVAMHNGQVVDSDTDELALYLRVRERFPMIGVLIKQVTAETETTWVMRSPRLEYE